jgi:hypothetical protein
VTDSPGRGERELQAPEQREPEPRNLEDAGPALRIREELLPGSEFTGRALRVDGPSDDPEDVPRRRPSHPDALLAGAGVAGLMLVAAVAFWSSGTERGDSLLQALGALLAAIGIGAGLLGVYLARTD